MTANFNIKKIYNAVEGIDGYEYSLEIIIVPLKERMTETNFFTQINILLLKETNNTTRSPVSVNALSFEE